MPLFVVVVFLLSRRCEYICTALSVSTKTVQFYFLCVCDHSEQSCFSICKNRLASWIGPFIITKLFKETTFLPKSSSCAARLILKSLLRKCHLFSGEGFNWWAPKKKEACFNFPMIVASEPVLMECATWLQIVSGLLPLDTFGAKNGSSQWQITSHTSER